ncbi:MAG: AAA family ATPase [Nitrososphaerota archaeon]
MRGIGTNDQWELVVWLRRVRSRPMSEQQVRVEEIISRICLGKYKGRDGVVFWQGHVDDWDIDLCRLMASMGLDADQIDQLIRLSPAWPKVADKWDSLTDDHGRTFGQRTIKLALISRQKQAAESKPSRPQPKRAAELMAKEIPPITWVIQGLLPQGLSILAGKPKLGKSWLALHLGLAVAYGGKALGSIDVPEAEILYLCLEDTERRLKERICKLTSRETVPSNFYYCTEWAPLLEGAYLLIDWLVEHPACKLVVIDTLAKIRPISHPGVNAYQADYTALSQLKLVADEFNAAILAVHHTRKMPASDILDTISGSTGITGCADTILILNKEGRVQADAILSVTGRDVEDQELALEFSPETGLWRLVGSAQEYRLSQERKQIIDLIRQTGRPMGPKEIAEALGKSIINVKKLLSLMARDGNLKLLDRGKYIPIIQGEI